MGDYVTPVPAQMRRGPRWFSGSADAIYQNLNIIGDERPEYICVFGADHIYRMDPRQMLDQHMATGAGRHRRRACGSHCPRRATSASSRPSTSTDGRRRTRIAAFREKPTDAVGLPDDPDRVFASMGNYIFTTEALLEAVTADSDDRSRITTSAETSSLPWCGPATPTSTTSRPTMSRARPTATAPTGATSGRSTPITTPTWIWSRFTHLQPVQPAVADLHLGTAASPGQVRVRGGRGHGRGASIPWFGRGDHLGGHGAAFHPLPGVHRREPRPGRGLSADATTSGSGPGRSSATPSSTRTSRSRRAPTSASNPDYDRRRFTVSDSGIVVIGKGQAIPEP